MASNHPTFISAAWIDLRQRANVHLVDNFNFNCLVILIATITFLVFNIASNLFRAYFPSKPRSQQLPPVVSHWFPVIGSAISWGRNPTQFMADCREKYGDVFTVVLFGRKVTVFLGAKGNKFVLGAKAAMFSAKDAYQHFTRPVFGKGAVHDISHEAFMEQKAQIRVGALSTSNFRVYVSIIEEEVLNHIQKNLFAAPKNNDNDGWGTFDVYHAISELIILAATHTLHGSHVRKNLNESITGYYDDLCGGLTPIHFMFPYLPLPSWRKRDRAQKELSQFYTNIIQKRRSDPSNHSDPDLIAALLDQKNRDGSPIEDRVIAHMMISMLVAGRHTCASTASWIIIHLAANPDIAELLYAEQIEHFGNPDGTLQAMEYDKIRQLPLMSAVIRETLRLHPPVDSMIRYVKHDTFVPAAIATPSADPAKDDPDMIYIVPKGSYVFASPAVTQIDARVWRDAGLWDPYRWTDSTGAAAEAGRVYENEIEEAVFKPKAVVLGSESPYQPFGGGVHRCIGEQFANMQMAVTIGTFIRQLQLCIPGHNSSRNTSATLSLDAAIQYRRRPCVQ